MISIRPYVKKLIILLFLLLQVTLYSSNSALIHAAETPTQNTTGESLPDTETAPVAPAAGDSIANTGGNIDIIQQTLESLRLEIENSRVDTDQNRGHVQAMKDGLDLIENRLKDAYSALDQSRTGIAGNTEKLQELEQLLLTSSRDVRTNSADLSSQKSLIEDNSVRLYELLIQLDAIDTQVKKFSQAVQSSADSSPENNDFKLTVNNDLRKIWMIVVTALVFLAPLAFSFPWQDSNNSTHSMNMQHSVVLACLFAIFGYLVVGFSLMYATSSSGWLGLGSYLYPGNTLESEGIEPLFSIFQFMPYQAGFITLAALIVTTILGRQLSALSQAGTAFFTGAVLIPIFGHWAWASRFTPGNKGWLEGAGFVDQSGATVISVVSACFALVVLYKLSRRSPEDRKPGEGLQPIYSAPTIIFLWLSWIGLTTGTLPFSGDQISIVVLNTLVAAVFGGITAFLPYALFGEEKISVARGLAGFASGLVAIAACAQSVTFPEAAIVGIGAGILQNLLFGFLRKLFLPHDHQIRAAYLITIHGVAGIWGTLCVALVGSEGNFALPNFIQLITQMQGLAAAIAYSIVMAYIATFLIMFRRKSSDKTRKSAV